MSSVAQRYRRRVHRSRRNYKATWLAAGVCAFAGLAFCLVLSRRTAQHDSTLSPITARNRSSSVAMQYVEPLLKWPHTLQHEIGPEIAEITPFTYAVSGIISAETDLSLRRKMRYDCIVSYWSRDQRWRCVYLQLDGQVVLRKPENQAQYLVTRQ